MLYQGATVLMWAVDNPVRTRAPQMPRQRPPGHFLAARIARHHFVPLLDEGKLLHAGGNVGAGRVSLPPLMEAPFSHWKLYCAGGRVPTGNTTQFAFVGHVEADDCMKRR